MEIKNVIEKLRKKSLLIHSIPKGKRKFLLDTIEENLKPQTVIRLSEPHLDFDAYIQSVKSKFPFIPPNWNEPNKYWDNLNRVWDFHLDWTEYSNNVVILLEDIDNLEDSWKYEIISDYITQIYRNEYGNKINRVSFRFIIILSEIEELFWEKVRIIGGPTNSDRRTEEQIIKGLVELIDANWIASNKSKVLTSDKTITN
ncbi:hypothetical protein [Portibacter marinus]|uniref:hypothetical protein n=1 Tax=Portibacter marinus TaxID=2898660 RepID=UPI001F45B775|nr:hypothetical protein [Portibacter marinus]